MALLVSTISFLILLAWILIEGAGDVVRLAGPFLLAAAALVALAVLFGALLAPGPGEIRTTAGAIAGVRDQYVGQRPEQAGSHEVVKAADSALAEGEMPLFVGRIASGPPRHVPGDKNGHDSRNQPYQKHLVERQSVDVRLQFLPRSRPGAWGGRAIRTGPVLRSKDASGRPIG